MFPMKFALLLLSFTVIVSAWLLAKDEAGAPVAADAGALAALDRRLQSLAESVDRLEGQVRLQSAMADAQATRAMEAAPPAAMAPVAAPEAVVAVTEDERASDVTVESAMARLLETGHWSAEGRAIWHELAEAGLLDEVVAAYRKRAEEDPRNADAQADLGDAIAQQSHSAANAMEQGALALQADLAYDAALALDANHWRARFNKAVSYTFWPAVMGKQAPAMEHFETLLGQQAGLPPQPGFEKTHLYLGNLHAQMGNHDKAKQIWLAGLQQFPNDPALLAALGL
jgi:tetratricopeptide (TPR) repeat protein